LGIQESSSVQDKSAPFLAISDQSRDFKDGIGDKHQKRVACTMPWTTIYINADGMVQTCCYSSQSLGDLKTQEFSEIWNGKKFQQLRNQIIKQEYPVDCQRCIANRRNRESILPLSFTREQILTKERLFSSWKGRTWEIIYRVLGRAFPFLKLR
jgi:radical SAM protein with 4Fe4S-binding SPASM domain